MKVSARDANFSNSAELAELGAGLEAACANARAWVRRVAHDSKRVHTEQTALEARSLKTELEARRLKAAATRRMCVGVFGPSQAGKSYLVSRLSTRRDAPADASTLQIRFGASTELNFLNQINPPGDKESTGLVTRFTTAPLNAPDDCPVVLRLFTETELVKVFANSFFSDFDYQNLNFDAPISPEEINAVVEQASMAVGERAAHLDEVTLYELEDYFRRNFDRPARYLSAAGYWESVIRLAPTLTDAGRAKLYSVLWGGIEEFTDLFVLLISALRHLNFAADAYAPLAALTPRDTTIIDVDRIKVGLGTAEDAQDVLEVAIAASSVRIGIARSTLCALTAELCLQVSSEVDKMFAGTDLLDFPGARSREKYRSLDENLDDTGEVLERARELFIRGKVAMLFQRYTDERELTSMLLCMPPSNQEVKDLALMVREWIFRTHGETAAERARQPTALFVVLTKSDADFMRKAGEDADTRAKKWDRRLEASVRAPFERDGWLRAWHERDGTTTPFNNTLWLRNPSVEQAHLIQYGDGPTGREEKALASEIEAELPELRSSFLRDANVASHFAAPERAFDALLSLNDGGISYLIERMESVCEVDTKNAQIQGRLGDAAHQLSERFESFYEAGNEASKDLKREQAGVAIEAIGRSLGNMRNFGHLLAQLQADNEELYGLYVKIARFGVPEEPPRPTDTASEVDEDEDGGSIFDFDDDDEEPAAITAPEVDTPKIDQSGIDPRTRAFADRAVQTWLERVSDTLPRLERHSKKTDDALMFVVEQLRQAAHRQQLVARIAESVATNGQSIAASWEDLAELGATVAGNEINSLVASLGYAELPPSDRPPVPPAPQAERRRAFAAADIFSGHPDLGKQRKRLERDFVQDWLAAIVQVTLDNLSSPGGREISEEENAALGAILASVKPVTELTP